MPHIRFRLKIFTIVNAQNVASFHTEMRLRRSNLNLLARASQLAKTVTQRVRAHYFVSVVAESGADTSGARSPVAEENTDDVVRVSGLNPDRNGFRNFRALKGQFSQIGIQISAVGIDKARALSRAGHYV